MRVTGGIFCGRRLQTVQAAPLRPTQDRVREALFSSLADVLPGCAFLDLYAGTGAVGIEAWSRGAARVCWVEQNRRVFRVLTDNIRSLSDDISHSNLTPQCLPVEAFCRRAYTAPFDIVFADPPYARNRATKVDVALLLAESALLKPDGLFILEQGGDEPVPSGCRGWQLLRERRYGSSMLRFFHGKGAE